MWIFMAPLCMGTKNKKQEDVYKLVIKDTKNIKKDSQLVIEIDS